MTHRSTLGRLATLVIAGLVCTPLAARAASAPYIPGHVIVKYKSGTSASDRQALRAQLGGAKLQDLAIIDAELIKVPAGTSVEKAIEIAERNPRVAYAEPDHELSIDGLGAREPHTDLVPNDPRFNELWGMIKISAPQAWDVYTGDPNLLVGVIDTGVDYTHPDLAANAWTNPGEIPGNSIDDDMNGYVDDIHGYDFVNSDGDPMDDNDHGTHCSGTIAGVGDNSVGVVGVNWNLKIVGIKFLSAGGTGSTANAILSVQYAVRVGVRLTSNSWGGGGFNQALLDAINAAGAAGQLFIAAAGNGSTNTDVSLNYPSCYDAAHIMSIGNSQEDDTRWTTSNWGLTTVDLFAPGHLILSSVAGGGYDLFTGTSMATPHVAGACAMVWGRFPGMTAAQVKQRIMDFADPVPALQNLCITGGRLNVFMAIADPDSITPGSVGDLVTVDPGSTTMGIEWTATGDDGGTGRASRTELRWSTSPIDDMNFAAATLVPTPNPSPAGNRESTEVTGLAYSTLYYFAIKAFDEFGNAGPLSNVATGTTLGAPGIGVTTLSQVTVNTGQQAQRTLTITNTGAGTLDFTIPPPELLFSRFEVGRKAARAQQPALALAKNQDDPRPGEPPVVIDAQGGPDAFGYRWIDSDQPAGGPTFGWVDISGIGTRILFTGDDQNLGPFPVGFTFPFYGTNFSTVRVCTNGWLSFTSTATSYDNQPLPVGGTNPPNLVAPFWDDLDFRSATSANSRAYYYNDGTRFIVSWHDVPHYPTTGPGGPYTFQVILYPSGRIEYQYLSIPLLPNSCTVGIQDATRTVALQTVFNSNYVHDNLALRIFSMPQWLAVSQTSGRVTPGNPLDIDVLYDATDLSGGLYEGIIHVQTNAPSNADVDAAMQVIGAPNITAGPASTDFGAAFVGFPTGRIITVSNNGTDPLVVTGIPSADPQVSAAPSSFSVAPGGSQNVTLTYLPTAVGALASTVTIESNDPDEPSKVLAVAGSANVPPDITTSATSLGAWMLQDTVEHQTLRITNQTDVSGADLVLTVSEAELSKASGLARAQQPVLELGKDEVDPRPGEPRTAASGGPDAFGYRFKDSDESNGPSFSWVDISGVGTQILFNGDDQNMGPFPIGFNFPFYGTDFSSVRVCSNGWVSFTSAATVYLNQTLPAAGTTPENLLAVFWDDLNFTASISPDSRCYYYNDGTRFIISYHDVPHHPPSGPGGPYTFQVILYPNGKIVYQYLSIPLLPNSCTIGIQNASRTIALQAVFNDNYVHDNLAIQIQRTADWLSVTPTGGTIAGRQFTDLDVRYDTAGMDPGVYQGNIRIASNDPNEAVIDIPVTLSVVTAPTDRVDVPVSFALSMAGTNPARDGARFMLAMPTREDVELRVYNVKGAMVRDLARTTLDPGYHPIGWDGRDAGGRRVASGVYFVRVQAGAFAKTLRVTLMR
jgi:subtilisin family serine protease